MDGEQPETGGDRVPTIPTTARSSAVPAKPPRKALLREIEALRGAISWIEPPFVDENTPADELRERVRFCVQDAQRAGRG